MKTGVEIQKELYVNIHDDYEAHYFDDISNKYRRDFIFGSLFDDIDINHLSVADLASGSGGNTIELLKVFPGAKVVGFDISPRACQAYRKNTGCDCTELNLMAPLPGSLAEKFDVVMIIGGLHHCISDLNQTLKNVDYMLRPGGYFLMCEPNSRFMLENIRKAWYRLDKYFDAETEAALDHNDIYQSVSDQYRVDRVDYMGGPGYFLLLNSMVLRIPLGVKKYLARFLFFADRIFNCLHGHVLFPVFCARWVKK